MYITQFAETKGYHLRVNSHLHSEKQFSACLQGVKFVNPKTKVLLGDKPLVALGDTPDEAINKYAKMIAGLTYRLPWSEIQTDLVPEKLKGLPSNVFSRAWYTFLRKRKLRLEKVAELKLQKESIERRVKKEYMG